MYKYGGDVKVKVAWGDTLTGECKRRKGGFKFLYDHLKDHYFLAIKIDNKEALVVVRAKDFAGMLQ